MTLTGVERHAFEKSLRKNLSNVLRVNINQANLDVVPLFADKLWP